MAEADKVLDLMLRNKALSRNKIKLVLAAKKEIGAEWDRDGRGAKGFPVNVAHLLADLKARLVGTRISKSLSMPSPKKPKRLADVLPDKLVGQVHEYLYEQPYEEALGLLVTGEGAWARMLHSIEAASAVAMHGEQALPAPRGNWLHRQILGIFLAATPTKFTDSEMAELFDHFCPCGIQHNREAIKKYRWRHSLRFK